MVGLPGLRAEFHLRADYPRGEGRCKPAICGESLELCFFRGCHHDDAIEFSGCPGFKQERHVNEEPAAGCAGGTGGRRPRGADAGVEDGLQFPAPRVVGKNDVAEAVPVGFSGFVERPWAECGLDFVSY